jgi:hypothetical protein
MANQDWWEVSLILVVWSVHKKYCLVHYRKLIKGGWIAQFANTQIEPINRLLYESSSAIPPGVKPPFDVS